MKVLFIGGIGKIISACSQLAVDQGIELYLLNRGQTLERPAPNEAKNTVTKCKRIIEVW